MPRALVIGGGIGGLAAAIALRQAGFDLRDLQQLVGDSRDLARQLRVMETMLPWHDRRNPRMRGRDYSGRIELFGEILDGEMQLNDAGNVVAESWRWLASQYHHATLDDWCVMPDHLHGILVLNDETAAGTVRKPVGRLVGAFKTVSTKRLKLLRNTPGAVVWQRSFWDHVVRDEADLDRIRRYVRVNAAVSL